MAGLVVGVAVVAGIVWFILRRRKLLRLQKNASPPYNGISSAQRELPELHELSETRDHEIDGREVIDLPVHVAQ